MLIRKLWPSIAWALFILILMGLPGDYIPVEVMFWEWLGPDKLVHIALFGALSFLVFYNLREKYLEGKNRYTVIVIVLTSTLAYGLLMEILQSNVFIGRNGNIYDFIANTLGILTGWLVFNIVIKKKNKIL